MGVRGLLEEAMRGCWWDTALMGVETVLVGERSMVMLSTLAAVWISSEDSMRSRGWWWRPLICGGGHQVCWMVGSECR